MNPNFKLGDAVIFNYSPDAKFSLKKTVDKFGRVHIPRSRNGPRHVIILAPNHQGKLHGLCLAYMYPKEQQMIYWFFNSVAKKQRMEDPLKKIKQEFEAKRQELEKQRQLQLQQQNMVIVKPGAQNQMQKPSPFKTSTFGKTQVETVKPSVQQMRDYLNQTNKQPANVNFSGVVDEEMYQRVVKYLETSEAQDSLVKNFSKQVPQDPFRFYHSIIKSLFQIKDIRRFYRTYSVEHINSMRYLGNTQ